MNQANLDAGKVRIRSGLLLWADRVEEDLRDRNLCLASVEAYAIPRLNYSAARQMLLDILAYELNHGTDNAPYNSMVGALIRLVGGIVPVYLTPFQVILLVGIIRLSPAR